MFYSTRALIDESSVVYDTCHIAKVQGTCGMWHGERQQHEANDIMESGRREDNLMMGEGTMGKGRGEGR